MKPHKWAKEIKAWADGAEIEFSLGKTWAETPNPSWFEEDVEYRIKPQPKEPQYLYVYGEPDTNIFFSLIPNYGFANYKGKIPLITENEDGA